MYAVCESRFDWTVSRARARGIVFFWLAALALPAVPAASAPAHSALPPVRELEQALRRARRLHLADAPYWRVLGHYTRTLSGWKSEIDDPRFFLSPRGKTDPEAELEATLRALFRTPAQGKKSAACRFPARLAWLRERLPIDPSALPAPECAEFERIFTKIDPGSLYLVFPTAFMNNPASMFGHTLLLIRARRHEKILSPAVNYAATTRETNGLLFAFKGIFGLYKGYYNVTPYYRKILEYNNIEQRDIWEYRLDFDREEIHRLMRHAWELQNIYSRYYFFHQNCSYALLFLLDAGRPGLELHRRTRPWVIPLDTIKSIARAGLITRADFRPSEAAKVRALAATLPAALQQDAIAIAEGRESPAIRLRPSLDKAAKARVLDLSADYLYCLRTRRKLPRNVYAPRYLRILTARSRLGITPVEPRIRPPARPEQGHGSMRCVVAAGVDETGGYQELRLRPAYHDLLDPDPGYLRGSEIDFMELAVRRYNGPRGLDLHRLRFLRILSLSPRDRFFHPVSWHLDLGVLHGPALRYGRERWGYLTAGGGWTVRALQRSLAYLLLEADVRGGSFRKHCSVGPGLEMGVVRNFGARWKVHLAFRAFTYSLGNRYGRLEFTGAVRYALRRNQALTLRWLSGRDWGTDRRQVALGWRLYF